MKAHCNRAGSSPAPLLFFFLFLLFPSLMSCFLLSFSHLQGIWNGVEGTRTSYTSTVAAHNFDKVCVWLSSAAGEVYVCENAAYHPYSEDEAAKVLAEHDVLVKVDMGTGDASAKAWGCDLTYDYVKINGDYRT